MTGPGSATTGKLTRAHIDHLAEPFPLEASEAEVREWTRLKLDSLPDIPATRVAVIHRLAEFQNVRDPESLVARLIDGKVAQAAGLPPLGKLLSVVSEPIAFVVADQMQAGEFGMILGTGEAAKSTWLLYVLICVALGRPVLGRYAVRQGPVALITGEDGIARIQMRAKAICAGHGWNWKEVDAQLFGLARVGVVLEDRAWTDHLMRESVALQPAVIGLDPLRDLTLAREAANEEIQPAIRFFRALSELDSRPTIPVIHHTGYGSGERAGADQGRGWSSLSRAARYIQNLTADKLRSEDEPLQVSVGISKNNDIGYSPPFGFWLRVEKEPGSHIWKAATLTHSTQEAMRRTTAHDVIVAVIDETPGITTNRMNAKVKARLSIDPKKLPAYRDELVEWGVIRSEPGPNRSLQWFEVEDDA